MISLLKFNSNPNFLTSSLNKNFNGSRAKYSTVPKSDTVSIKTKAKPAIMPGLARGKATLKKVFLPYIRLVWKKEIGTVKKDAKEIQELKPDRQAIGMVENPKPFTEHKIKKIETSITKKAPVKAKVILKKDV